MRSSAFFAMLILPLIFRIPIDVKIRGKMKQSNDGHKIYLSYHKNGRSNLDSTVVRSGSFAFHISVDEVQRAYLSRNDNPATANFLHDALDIYLEQGTVIINSPDSLRNATLSGTPLNQDLAVLNKVLKPWNKEGLSLPDPDTFSPVQLLDSALVAEAWEAQRLHYLAGFPLKFAFINAHPDSYVSLVTLSQLAKTSQFVNETDHSFSILNDHLKETALGAEISARIDAARVISIGADAREISQPDSAGRIITLSAFRGKYILLDFWASWCLPCRQENPNLKKAYGLYHEKGFDVISISIDTKDDRDKWLQAVKKDGLQWTNVSDLSTDNAAAKAYGIRNIPANVLIDPAGTIIAKDLKGEELQRRLAEIFSQ